MTIRELCLKDSENILVVLWKSCCMVFCLDDLLFCYLLFNGIPFWHILSQALLLIFTSFFGGIRD